MGGAGGGAEAHVRGPGRGRQGQAHPGGQAARPRVEELEETGQCRFVGFVIFTLAIAKLEKELPFARTKLVNVLQILLSKLREATCLCA